MSDLDRIMEAWKADQWASIWQQVLSCPPTLRSVEPRRTEDAR